MCVCVCVRMCGRQVKRRESACAVHVPNMCNNMSLICAVSLSLMCSECPECGRQVKRRETTCASSWSDCRHTFSKVSALTRLLCKHTIEIHFQKPRSRTLTFDNATFDNAVVNWCRSLARKADKGHRWSRVGHVWCSVPMPWARERFTFGSFLAQKGRRNRRIE